MYRATVSWSGMHEPFLSLLQEALEHHGMRCTRQAALEGRSGTVYTVPLLVEHEGKAFILDVHLEDDLLPEAAVQDMADVMHDAGADGGVMCHVGTTEAGAGDGGVVLWGRDELVRLVGSARLAAATGCEADEPRFREQAHTDGPVAQSVDEILPPAFLDSDPAPEARGESAGDLDALPFAGGIDLDALEMLGDDDPARQARAEARDPPPAAGPWAVAPEDTARGGQGAAPAPDGAASTPPGDAASTPPGHAASNPSGYAAPTLGAAGARGHQASTPAGQDPHTYPLLPVRVLPDEARLRVKDRIYHVDAVQMVLQPVHLLDYECDLLAEGSLRYDTVTGRVQIDGTDKTPAEVDPEALDPAGFTRLDDAPGLPAQERTLRTSPERAREVAATFLTDAHTRLVDVEVEDEEDSYSYTEKKRVAPRPDHVRLNPLGVFHRVLWRISGPNGHIDVDAITGHTVEEQLKRPNPDAVMLD